MKIWNEVFVRNKVNDDYDENEKNDDESVCYGYSMSCDDLLKVHDHSKICAWMKSSDSILDDVMIRDFLIVEVTPFFHRYH